MYIDTHTQRQGLEHMELGREGISARGTSVSRPQRKKLAACVLRIQISSVCLAQK